MNVKEKVLRLFAAITVGTLLFATTSCSDSEETGSNMFALTYQGTTDIGPSTKGVISRPEYVGNVPHDFVITKVTLNGEALIQHRFTINSGNGMISLADASALSKGLFRISVSCISDDREYRYDDIVTVNRLESAPQGITVTPNRLKADKMDVINEAPSVSLPTAQVTLADENLTITHYAIAQSSYSDFFAISSTGEISIVPGNKEITAGTYPLSLKLTTATSGETILENALEVTITSMTLTYTPDKVSIGEEVSNTFQSAAPVLKGVTVEGAVYEIKRVTPANKNIKIDSETGVISVASNQNLERGTYVIDINVVNEKSKEIVDFNGAFTLEVLGYIRPIENLRYEDAEYIEGAVISIEHTDDFIGDEVTFELVELDPRLAGKLNIDAATGTISAPEGHKIPADEYSVKVKATNEKGPVTAILKLTITPRDVNEFTYIKYGNNLGLDKDKYAAQYRVISADDLKNLVLTPETDINPEASVTWKIEAIFPMKGVTISSNGALKFTDEAYKGSPGKAGVVIVTATTPKTTMKIPVFIHLAAAVNGVEINYTPFVFQVNPKTGGRSLAPDLIGVSDRNNFLLDFRRSFSYYRINGNHVNGQPSVASSFMSKLWDQYYGRPASEKYGSYTPITYNDNKADLSKALAYTDTDCTVVVNPEKWKDESDGTYANGVLVTEMTYATDGKNSTLTSSTNLNKVCPFIIWFDENFK